MGTSSLAALGGELRARRNARGLTRAALAQAAGTRPVIIGRWERGEGAPTREQLQMLAEVLELPPALAAGWEAAAERAGLSAEAGGPPGPAQAAARREWWLPGRRAAVAPAMPANGGRPGKRGGGADWSYLDDPAEQRRYALRWAVSMVILGALAVCLIWALGELADGWRALIELFRSGPPAGGPAAALGLAGII
jgi:transcriptional regulator with XRE-family HTH domain